MSQASHFQLFAEYNRWMNRSLFASAAKLPADEITVDRGAFFGSILGTLNHLAVADTIWLKRFSTHAAGAVTLQPMSDVTLPTKLDQTLFSELSALQGYREWLDELIVKFVGSLEDEALNQSLVFSSLKGVPASRNFCAVLMHFFNHQTHHRGQVTTLLFQAGVDPGATDLLVLVPADRIDS
jgi:uncharacterized damage-inducible protein DinB